MAINIEVPKVRSAETPQEILVADFKSLGGALPIHGGWGYSKEDAVVIDKNDLVVSKNVPFDGIGIEYIFIEKRIYEELIIFRPKDSKYSGIKWNLLEQRTENHKNKMYDVLSFEVTAFSDKDWSALKTEWERNNGFQSSEPGLKNHLKKKNEKMVCYTTEYWFDITSFYGT